MKRPGYLGNVEENPLVILVRQAARWATAANQDENPMIAVLHANYGAGYLWALQDIATADEIEAATGINWKRFRASILAAQDAAARKLAKACPGYAPRDSYLARVAKEI